LCGCYGIYGGNIAIESQWTSGFLQSRRVSAKLKRARVGLTASLRKEPIPRLVRSADETAAAVQRVVRIIFTSVGLNRLGRMKPADRATKDDQEMIRLLERLDRLQTQLDDLNRVLKRRLDRIARRRKSHKLTLQWFTRQAKRLADHAPS
jgi:hypothetical protein